MGRYMDYQELMRTFGTLDVSATFGLTNPMEVVGPLKPKAVHYGVCYTSDPDDGHVFTNKTVPLLFFEFNKYRPDLPPWRKVHDIVLGARDDDGTIYEQMFFEGFYRGTQTTGGLKTVSISAKGPYNYNEDDCIVTRDAISGDGNDPGNINYKVNEVLK